MKSINSLLLILILGALTTFGACHESEELPEFRPEFETLNPVISEDAVVFKASLIAEHPAVDYGFVWFEKTDSGEPVVHTIHVGSGIYNGEYTLTLTDLPKNTELVVCAYVEYEYQYDDEPVETAQEMGEDIDFTWDL